MELKELITDKIVNYSLTQQIVMILGPTKSGKVTISRELANRTGYDLFIADDFINDYGLDTGMEIFKNTIDSYHYSGKKAIFEGILCYRLLRKLIKDGYYIPDIIIKVNCNEETINYFYNKEEPEKNLKYVNGFNRGLEKIWSEIKELVYYKNINLKVLELNTSIY